MSADVRICLVGAGGYTGRLVAERLLQLGVPFAAVTRAAAKLPASWREHGDAITVVEADLLDVGDVSRLVTSYRLFVNCAGPFQWYSHELVRGVALAGGAYVDVCGEAAFVAWSRSALHERAQGTGALLVHACALESLPADLLAASICEPGRHYERIVAYYILPAGAASRGTLQSMRLVASQKAHAWDDGHYVERAPGSDEGPVELAVADGIRHAIFAPYPEVQFWPRRYTVRSAGSYLLVPPLQAKLMQVRQRQGRLISTGATSTAAASSVAEPTVSREGGAGPAAGADGVPATESTGEPRRDGPAEGARRGHAFTVAVQAIAEGADELVWLTGRDPYGVTAHAAVWAALEIAGMSERRAGVWGPADVLDGTRFLRAAAEWPFGVTLHRGSA